MRDVTTTPDQPPEFRALEREKFNLSRDMKYPASLAALQIKTYPLLQPLFSDLPAPQLFELVQALALEMPGWEIAAVEASRLQLEAVASGRLPGFKIDVVIQVRPEGENSRVHMRCKVRRLGAPARCIRIFFKRLKDKLV